MNDTHYIPAFTESNGRKQRAICGVWIRQDAHTPEPSCGDCTRWLEADAKEAAKYGSVEEQADALFGPPDPSLVVKPTHFESTAGYRTKGGR